MHTMLSTSITDSSEVPAPLHQATVVAKTNASGLAAAATSNSVSGPSARIISVHDALLAQNEMSMWLQMQDCSRTRAL